MKNKKSAPKIIKTIRKTSPDELAAVFKLFRKSSFKPIKLTNLPKDYIKNEK